MNRHRWPTLQDFLNASAVIGSVWTLLVIFLLVLPSIRNETVHKSDKTVLTLVYSLATWSTAAAMICGLVLGVCGMNVWRTIRRRSHGPTRVGGLTAKEDSSSKSTNGGRHR